MIWLSVALMGGAALVFLLVCYGISGEGVNPGETEGAGETGPFGVHSAAAHPERFSTGLPVQNQHSAKTTEKKSCTT